MQNEDAGRSGGKVLDSERGEAGVSAKPPAIQFIVGEYGGGNGEGEVRGSETNGGKSVHFDIHRGCGVVGEE